jgi:hypothetical protein
MYGDGPVRNILAWRTGLLLNLETVYFETGLGRVERYVWVLYDTSDAPQTGGMWLLEAYSFLF